MAEYIEREELERILETRYERLGAMRPDFYAGFMAATRIVEQEMPNADVAPVVHAEWDDDCRCTNCGKEALCDEKPDPYVKGLNALFYVNSDYCPNCGAKMDAEKI